MAHPAAHLAPTVEHRHGEHVIRFCAARGFRNGAEFVAHFRNAVYKLIEFRRQRQISAEPDPVQRFAHDGATRGIPVFIEFRDGGVLVAVEERIGEEIRQEPPLPVFDIGNFRKHAHRNAAAHAAYDRVEPRFLEIFAVRLGADPIVAEEHHRFLSVGMNDIGQRTHRSANALLHETHIISETRRRYAERVIIATAVDKVFRAEFVAVFLFEISEHCGRSRHAVTEPVYVFFLALFVENQRKLI